MCLNDFNALGFTWPKSLQNLLASSMKNSDALFRVYLSIKFFWFTYIRQTLCFQICCRRRSRNVGFRLSTTASGISSRAIAARRWPSHLNTSRSLCSESLSARANTGASTTTNSSPSTLTAGVFMRAPCRFYMRINTTKSISEGTITSANIYNSHHGNGKTAITYSQGHFSADCSSANILNIARLWNKTDKTE